MSYLGEQALGGCLGRNWAEQKLKAVGIMRW